MINHTNQLIESNFSANNNGYKGTKCWNDKKWDDELTHWINRVISEQNQILENNITLGTEIQCLLVN